MFHLAALADIVPPIQGLESYFRSDVAGTSNVLQASTLAKIDRLVYVASMHKNLMEGSSNRLHILDLV